MSLRTPACLIHATPREIQEAVKFFDLAADKSKEAFVQRDQLEMSFGTSAMKLLFPISEIVLSGTSDTPAYLAGMLMAASACRTAAPGDTRFKGVATLFNRIDNSRVRVEDAFIDMHDKAASAADFRVELGFIFTGKIFQAHYPGRLTISCQLDKALIWHAQGQFARLADSILDAVDTPLQGHAAVLCGPIQEGTNHA